MTRKIVINKCYGGFSLSPSATKTLAKLQGKKCYFYEHSYNPERYNLVTEAYAEVTHSIIFAFDAKMPIFKTDKAFQTWYGKHVLENRPSDRADPLLIQVVEQLGENANGTYAELAIVEVPDDVDWAVEEYDGREWIAEVHRTWH